jgi:hypothetical protein
MLEEAPCIARRHGLKRPTHRFYERLAGACLGLPQQRLELGERFPYGVEVRRVGRQVQKLAAPTLDQLPNLPNPRPLVGERLSITTTCPGVSAEARTRSA